MSTLYEADRVFHQFHRSAPELAPEDDGSPFNRHRFSVALWLLWQQLLHLEESCEFAADYGGPDGYLVPARLKFANAAEWERFSVSARNVANSMLATGFKYEANSVAEEIALYSALVAAERRLRDSDPEEAQQELGYPIDALLSDVSLAASFVLDDADTFEHFDPMLDGSGPPLAEWFDKFDHVLDD